MKLIIFSLARSNKNRGPPVYFYAKKAIKNLRKCIKLKRNKLKF